MWGTLVLAWRQLSHNLVKLMVAIAGVVVAVLLMLVQLGFLQAAYDSSLGLPKMIKAEIVVISPKTLTIFRPVTFPRVQFSRLAGHPSVASLQGVYLGTAQLRNPWTYCEHPILVYGLEPQDDLIDLPGFANQRVRLRSADVVVFDELSRPCYGPIVKNLAAGQQVEFEVNHRRVRAIGTTHVGVTIGLDGSLFTTDANFLRIFQQRIPGAIDLGLVKLRPGTDSRQARDALQAIVGRDATVMTQEEFLVFETTFLQQNAPIDFIFTLGAAVGFFIGFVIVYQILYTDVTNHLPQYATLKAIGFTDGYLLRLVLFEALLLAVLGFGPGVIMAWGIYVLADKMTQLPLVMTVARLSLVFGLTLTMCAFSGAMAVRKLRAADPADVF